MRQWRNVVLSVLGACMVVASNAMALPDSTHYSGSTSYYFTGENGSILSGDIEFAVYDTVAYSNEYVGAYGLTSPGSERYIYAYQIFNDWGTANVAVDYFAILGIKGSVEVGTETDGDYWAVDATSAYYSPDSSRVIYKFANGVLMVGAYSAYLVFASDYDWVKGDYEIKGKGVGDNQDIPSPDIPEPATLALMSAGTILSLRLKRRAKRV